MNKEITEIHENQADDKSKGFNSTNLKKSDLSSIAEDQILDDSVLTPTEARNENASTAKSGIGSFHREKLTSNTSSTTSRRESSDNFTGDSDEEYFEEYHLPNTHENAFVRHLSFRKKVQSTTIDAPDAERIEGLVRTGEFVRHNSIRKKIVPEEPINEDELPYESNYDFDFNSNFGGLNSNIGSFSEDKNMNELKFEENLNEDFKTAFNTTSNFESNQLKRTTSTPRPGGNDYNDLEETTNSNIYDESSEDEMLRKIQECLNINSYKDVLNLSGRLSDILSPKEVEEVLKNSERYTRYLNSEVFEALSLSYQGHSQSLPYFNTSNSHPGHMKTKPELKSNNFDTNSSQSRFVSDSGFSSPKSNRRCNLKLPNNDVRLIEKPSTPIGGIAAPGIFIECDSRTNSNLRKICAPKINLSADSENKADSESDYTDDTRYINGTIPDKTTQTARKKLFSSDDSTASDGQLNGDKCNEVILNPADISDESYDFSQLPPPDLIPEFPIVEEHSDMRHWRNVVIGGAWKRIDMKVIDPYKKCISHGGTMDGSENPIVVFCASLLPQKSCRNYHYIMDNLLMYVLSFVEQILSDDYVLVYFSHAHSSGPGFAWMKRAYDMIDRRLRKNLKQLLMVHPTIWSKTILRLCRPFISAKFYRKINYVPNLIELAKLVPLEELYIPECVKQADYELMLREMRNTRVA